MAKPQWPEAASRDVLGKRVHRLDGPPKSTGRAKYAYDINRKDLLYVKPVGSPHPKATLNAVDVSAAEAVPGVEYVWIDEDLVGQETSYVHQIVAAVAATTEEAAYEAARLVKLDLSPAEFNAVDDDPALVSGRPSENESGEPDAAFDEADAVTEDVYGSPTITHCCMEPHGQTNEMRDGALHIWPSTQNVSRYADTLAAAVELDQSQIHVDCQYMGGGFGSKFGADKWGIVASLISKATGKPVKFMLDRDFELAIAGNRPSAYATVKVGVKKDGSITALDANAYGSAGPGGWSAPPIPYVFSGIPNQRVRGQRIGTDRGSQRAWRAPNHPQGCLITMSALADAAAAIGMDELEFFKKNLGLTSMAELYAQELDIAADMIGYAGKKHLRGEGGAGPVKRGLGISMHTWGGRGHASECDVTIRPDGSTGIKMGTQDLGVGTRTVIAIVVAETFGIPVERVASQIGKSEYPQSGGSGGSTTVGGVSTSARYAATNALNKLLALAAPELDVEPDALEAEDGVIRVADDHATYMTWDEACALLGTSSITERGVCDPNEAESAGMLSAGVGGVQMADVSVDVETGVVTVNEMVAVQDCGLVIDLLTAESQVLGGLIMGITYGLYEECVYDSQTGRMLNADMEFYRLAGLYDVGKLKVHMMTGPGFDERGVIGLGEPPVISPGAALSNAVANAIGKRVGRLPITPDKVVMALA